PHLPGAALILLTVVAATRFVETGRTQFALYAGICAGAAFGMVLTGIIAFAVLVMMVILRRDPARRRLIVLVQSLIAGGVVFLITNPFIPINALFHPQLLRSN